MRPNQASSLILVAFGVTVMLLARQLGLGNAKRIGPGFVSFWAAAILCGLGILLFASELISANKSERQRVSQLWAGLNWKNPLFVLATIVGYILVYRLIGFILSSTIMLMVLFYSLKPVRFWRDSAIAVLGSVITFVVFDLWLKVLLPHQFLERLLINIRNLIF